ncbi:MAG: UDP-N-acetylmuramoyl-tripeptide--D-alanyl-D-alanine ligase [Oscillospiraceae bacterium]|nr:UDP-N-acetylmuramoyl-tripeptide--D-alanyl-D-alanine ligase [Oscillospiraceae bacterium]
MTVEQMIKSCNGILLCGDPSTVVRGGSIDSRRTKEGDLFVPLIGERSNGHGYIASAFAKGAVATLTQEHREMDDPDHCWIYVPDTQTALQEIAKDYRSQFSIPIIGITGSVGKTTTKEMVALALSAGENVMKTKGNFNSQVGLPITLFGLEPEHTAAVIEMGMSEFGEMSRLAEIAKPNYAIITNIGMSHIENLKTQKNIRNEKLHIMDYFDRKSVLFLNGDDPILSALIGFLPCKTIVYGTGYNAHYQAKRIVSEDKHTTYALQTPIQGRTVHLPALGKHNVLNSLAAIAVADYLGVNLDAVVEKIGQYVPPAMRQEIHEVNGITIIDDTYNASPDSIRSGLDVLQGLECRGRRVAVLADMLELGELSEQAHFDVGVAAAQAGVSVLVTVGKRAENIGKGAKSVNPSVLVCSQKDNEQAVKYLQHKLRPGDCVIVKGSRGMKTDEIVRGLLQHAVHEVSANQESEQTEEQQTESAQ